MLIPHESALRFIEGYQAILLRVLADAGIATSNSIIGDLIAARSHAKDQPELIAQAIAGLESACEAVEASVVAAINSMKIEQWVYLRHTKTFAVFIDQAVENVYQVRALTTPLNELMVPPYTFEAGVFEYEGVFVCDGLVRNPMALGRNYEAEFKAQYTTLRKAGRLHARAAAPAPAQTSTASSNWFR